MQDLFNGRAPSVSEFSEMDWILKVEKWAKLKLGAGPFMLYHR
jgi:hypothetical protein